MVGTLSKIYRFAGKHQGHLKKSLFFSFLNGVFASLQIPALFFAVSAIISENKDFQNVWYSFGIMLVSVLGRIGMSIIYMNEQTEVGYGMVAEKRISIGDRLRYIPMGFFNKNNIGSITGIVTTTLSDVENYAPIVLVSMFGGFCNSIGLIIVLTILNIKLGLVSAIAVVLYMIITEIATRKSTRAASKRQNAQKNLVESVLEYIQGMSVVKGFGVEKESKKSVVDAIRDSNERNLKLVLSVAPYVAIQQLVIRVSTVVLLIIDIYLYTTGEISIIYGILFAILSFLLFSGLESAGSQITILQMLSASIDTANSIDDTPLMDVNGSNIKVENLKITFEDVSFAYGNKKILENVNLTIPEKTTTAIVGPSGSGKTTMCNLIARFWDVTSGKITLGGKNVKDFTLDSLMENISMVFQNVYLFADTIENNIKFGCPKATYEEAVEASKKACCHEFINSLPNGYKTMVEEGGENLSGGERQRIAIARAMLKDAPIIILDEATSSVDPENEYQLQKAIEALTHEKTIIMIAHRLKTVKNADQILVLNDGHIVQQGTHEELMKEKGVYQDFVSIKKESLCWKII